MILVGRCLILTGRRMVLIGWRKILTAWSMVLTGWSMVLNWVEHFINWLEYGINCQGMIINVRCCSFNIGRTAVTGLAAVSIAFVLLFSSCRQETAKSEVGNVESVVMIDFADRKQTIEHFG